MANPQLENGYTRIANEILDRLAGQRLTGTQLAIVLVIIRSTYGWDRKEAQIGLTYLANATNISKNKVKKALDELIEKGIILVAKENTATASRFLQFNKDYEQWQDSIPKGTQYTEEYIGGIRISTQGRVPKGIQGSIRIGIPTKKVNKVKENNKEKTYSPVEQDSASIPYHEVISYLNEKCGTRYKATTKKTRDLIQARWNEKFDLDDFKWVIDVKTAEWLKKEDMQKYLRPETLFGNKFESYLNQKANNRGGTHGKFTEDYYSQGDEFSL